MERRPDVGRDVKRNRHPPVFGDDDLFRAKGNAGKVASLYRSW